MNAKHGVCGLILGAAIVFGGCDKKADQTQAPKPASRPNAEQYNAAMERATTEREKAGQRAAEAAQKASGAAANTAAEAGAKTSDAVNDAKSGDAARNAQATAGDAAEKAKAQGNDLLAKLDAAVKSNKLDEGQTYVDQFEKIKDAVPAEVKAKYDALKAQFAAAKAKAAEPNK
jgi:hypothetical protein